VSNRGQSRGDAPPLLGAGPAAELAARAAITDVLWRYSGAIRLRQPDRLDTVFTPDAVIDYRAIGGERSGVGATKLFILAALEGTTFFEHVVSSVTIEFSSDRRSADVASVWHSVYVLAGGGGALLGYGTYDDKFLADDRWRIAERAVRSESQVHVSVH
jgi:hypothetical protein